MQTRLPATFSTTATDFESVASASPNERDISATREGSLERSSSCAIARARFQSGAPDGLIAQTAQGLPYRICRRANLGSTPARTNDDFPEPEAPWISTRLLFATRSMTSSII